MEGWTYRGVPVRVARTAEIPWPYRLGRPSAHVVQEILNGMEPWDTPEVSETVIDFDPMPVIVTPVGARTRFWARHAGHHARDVGYSPFVRTFGERLETTEFTILMVGPPSKPMLVRAYPGNEMPPLPWQRHRADGRPESLAFWREHAYVYTSSRVHLGSETDVAPSWF